MNHHPRGLLALGLTAALAGAAYGGQAAFATGPTGVVPILVGAQAAHHSGFDRIVFQFSGAVPARRQVRYVDRLIADPSGRLVQVAGVAILQVSF